MSARHYSRADFDAYDRSPWKAGDDLRFCCIECGDSKPRDNKHRSLRLRVAGDKRGLFLCGRCGLKGKVTEEWAERPRLSRRERAVRAVARTRFDTPPPRQPEPPDSQKLERLSSRMESYRRAFARSPGARYLEGRGIPEEVAELAGVGYAERWEHWEEVEKDKWELLGSDRRVVFPVLDRAGSLVAISGRAVGADFHRAKFISQGPKSLGLFTSPGALSARCVAVCEAAIDALALWLCGVPAVAGIGTTFPEWLPRALAFKHVLLATDEDEPDRFGRCAGQEAARALGSSLRAMGAKTLRLSAEGFKDWGAALEGLGTEPTRHGLVGFAEESDDFDRIFHADDLSSRGHAEGAQFVAGLVEDPSLRAAFLSSVRPGDAVWHRAFAAGETQAMLEAFAPLGVEVVGLEPRGSAREEAA